MNEIDSEFATKISNLASHFENVFQRLLTGEQLDLYANGVSGRFEIIAANLLADVRPKHLYFDGVVDMISTVKTCRQVEITGKMWVGDHNTQWKEDFRATITDKRTTKQGLWIMIWIGQDKAEGELMAAFGVSNE